MALEKFIFHIDPETRTKLERLSLVSKDSMSEVIRSAILREYEEMTKTMRVPIVVKVDSDTGLVTMHQASGRIA